MNRILLLPALLLLSACPGLRPLEPVPAEPPGDLSRPVIALPGREVFTYRGTLAGVPAGEGVFTFKRAGDLLEGSARIETTGLVSLLYGMAIRADSAVGADDLKSRRFSWSTGDEEEIEKSVMVRFDPETGHILSVIRKGGDVDKVERELPGARDPLGLILALRRSDLSPGRTFATALFTEWNAYRAEGQVIEDETISCRAGEFATRLVRVDLRKVVDGVPEEEPQAIAVWITPDERRLLVRIALETKIGRVTLNLTSFE